MNATANYKRSKCLTCEKQKGSTELLSLAEALVHSENFVDHHVIWNPDSEEENANRGDFNA